MLSGQGAESYTRSHFQQNISWILHQLRYPVREAYRLPHMTRPIVR